MAKKEVIKVYYNEAEDETEVLVFEDKLDNSTQLLDVLNDAVSDIKAYYHDVLQKLKK